MGGVKRQVGSTASIGFHAVYQEGTEQEIGWGNAVVGSYLGQLGLSDEAIYYITHAPPANLQWLTNADAAKLGIEVEVLPQTAMLPPEEAPNIPTPKEPTPPPPPPSPAVPLAGATLLGEYGDWRVYWAGYLPIGAWPRGGACFVMATPASNQTVPPNQPRGAIYIVIMLRMKGQNEISAMAGYGLKAATMEIGNSRFAMSTYEGEASPHLYPPPADWRQNHARVVQLMRNSSELTITGFSNTGFRSVDHYSLKGLDQALNQSDKCSISRYRGR